MVFLLRQCPENAGKVCNRFLPVRDNDPHQFCASCRGKTCNIDDRCEDCHDWTDYMWHRLGEYLAKLSVQQERKKERRAKAASSSSSFSGFSPSMPVPLCQLSSPYDNVVATSVASSAASAVTFEALSPVVSASQCLSPLSSDRAGLIKSSTFDLAVVDSSDSILALERVVHRSVISAHRGTSRTSVAVEPSSSTPCLEAPSWSRDHDGVIQRVGPKGRIF